MRGRRSGREMHEPFFMFFIFLIQKLKSPGQTAQATEDTDGLLK